MFGFVGLAGVLGLGIRLLGHGGFWVFYVVVLVFLWLVGWLGCG